MNKTIKILFSISFIIFFFIFLIQLFTTRVILNSYKFDTLRSLTYKLNNEFPEANKENEYIKEVTYNYIENDVYEIFIVFNDLNLNVKSIKVNSFDYSFTKPNTFYLTTVFKPSQLEKLITIQSITLNSNEEINVSYSFTLFSQTNIDIINTKKQSIVGVSTRNSWGSGIVLEKNEKITKNLFGKEKKLYEYIILTAEHVVENNKNISIHYNNTYNTFGDVVVLATYAQNNDLAILKLTTTNNSIVPLNDKQFSENEAVNYEKGDIVFTVGSPKDKNINFNSIAVGKIINTNYLIDLCGNNCQSIEYTNSLGSGSSGGALFDQQGNLIGLHFAGDSKNNFGYSIPIETILEITKNYLNTESITSQITTDFVFQKTY